MGQKAKTSKRSRREVAFAKELALRKTAPCASAPIVSQAERDAQSRASKDHLSELPQTKFTITKSSWWERSSLIW